VSRARQEAAVAIEEAEWRAAELVDAAKAEREQLIASALSDAAAARAGLEAESERLHAGIETARSHRATFLRQALAQVEELSAVAAPASEHRESERPEESPPTTELRQRLTTVAASTEGESSSEQP